MSLDALSNKQFNTERNMIEQGNMDQLATRVRGIQNMTSNVYRPAFSNDYTRVHSMPSGTAGGEGSVEGGSGAGMEEEEDEEA
jgi:hypothetical protein